MPVPDNTMNIVFMGTPDFAVPTLKSLIASKHDVRAVVTAPDKPSGRGKKISYSAVKKMALQHDLPVLQPKELKDPHFIDQLDRLKADLFIVVAFRILPYEVFSIPSKGTINLHASLLPKYRGAAPINWALIRGEKETGITTFFIDRQIDTGEWLMQKRVDIDPDITAGELYAQLKELGSDLVLQTIEGLETHSLVSKAQIGEVTKAPKINRELGFLDWQKMAIDLHNLIRGLSPVPGCTVLFRDQVIKILRSRLVDTQTMEKISGCVVKAGKNGPLTIQTGKGILEILKLQPTGKNALSAAEFIRGYRVTENDCFHNMAETDE